MKDHLCPKCNNDRFWFGKKLQTGTMAICKFCGEQSLLAGFFLNRRDFI